MTDNFILTDWYAVEFADKRISVVFSDDLFAGFVFSLYLCTAFKGIVSIRKVLNNYKRRIKDEHHSTTDSRTAEHSREKR